MSAKKILNGGKKMRFKNEKHISSAVAILFVASLVLSGCGSQSEGKKPQAEKTATATTATTAEDGREIVGNVYKQGLPIVKDKVTLTTVVRTNPLLKGKAEDLKMWKVLEERTNVHIEMEEIPGASYNEKVKLRIAGNDLPDVFLTSIPGVQYKKEQFMDLKKLIDEWAPNYKKILDDHATFANNSNMAGEVFVTPFGEVAPWLDVTDALFVNTEWLKKLNLSAPTDLNEFYNVLKAFKEKDPNGNGLNDELPFVFLMKKDYNMALRFMANFELPVDQGYRMIRDKKMIFGAQEKGFRECMDYLHKLYAEGLMDKENLTQDWAQLQAKGKGEHQLIGSFIAFWGDDFCTPEGTKAFDSVPPLKSSNGKQMWLKTANYAYPEGMSISAKCKNAEAAIRWADYIIETPFRAYEVNYGPEELGLFTKTADGKALFNTENPPEGIGFEEWTRNACIRDMIPYCITQQGVVEGRAVDAAPQRKLDYNEKYTPFLYEPITGGHLKYFESDDVKQEFYTLEEDLRSITDQFVAQAVIDGCTDEKWNTLQNTLKKAKIDRYLEIAQKAVDKYYETSK